MPFICRLLYLRCYNSDTWNAGIDNNCYTFENPYVDFKYVGERRMIIKKGDTCFDKLDSLFYEYVVAVEDQWSKNWSIFAVQPMSANYYRSRDNVANRQMENDIGITVCLNTDPTDRINISFKVVNKEKYMIWKMSQE